MKRVLLFLLVLVLALVVAPYALHAQTEVTLDSPAIVSGGEIEGAVCIADVIISDAGTVECQACQIGAFMSCEDLALTPIDYFQSRVTSTCLYYNYSQAEATTKEWIIYFYSADKANLARMILQPGPEALYPLKLPSLTM